MCTKCRRSDNLQTIVLATFQMLYNLNSISNERWDFKLCKFTTLTSDILGQGINAIFEKIHLILKHFWILVIFKESVDLFVEEVRGQFVGLCLAEIFLGFVNLPHRPLTSWDRGSMHSFNKAIWLWNILEFWSLPKSSLTSLL